MQKILTIAALVAMLTLPAAADEIAVTVYNSNLGVVSETRTLEFDKGTGQLAFRDVPSSIDPASVRFELAKGADDVQILEQNYAFDLVGPDQLYSKFIDREIDLTDKDGNLYSGTLLAYSGGAVTLQEPSGRVRMIQKDNIADVNFPALPEGLITRPTLFWLYASDISGSRQARVGYQTRGLQWNAEYVGVLDKDDKNLNLSGWASINNTSGKTYENAKLKLIAGDIARAAKGGQPSPVMRLAEADTEFKQKAFFEYHMYTLPRNATLADNEMKQISLFDPATTGVNKIFMYQPDRNATQVEVAIEFVNSAESGLGMPLPAGRVRTFKADEDGSLILLGEDMIEHTPRNEKVSLTIGYAFDIAADETSTERRRISTNVEEIDYQVELRNRKDEPITVQVEKKLYGFWEITKADFEYTAEDATTLTWKASLKPDEVKTYNYTVRITRR